MMFNCDHKHQVALTFHEINIFFAMIVSIHKFTSEVNNTSTLWSFFIRSEAWQIIRYANLGNPQWLFSFLYIIYIPKYHL